jgi:hypothetical protein
MKQTSDQYGDNYLEAIRRIDAMVADYNDVRLHAALGYIEPRVVHPGDADARRFDASGTKPWRREDNRRRPILNSAERRD